MPRIVPTLLLLAYLCSVFAFPVHAQSDPICTFDPLIAGMFSQISQARWAHWIAELTGEKEVTIAGQPVFIVTRDNRRMAEGDPAARAYEYVEEQLRTWLAKRARIESIPYLMYLPPDEIYQANNLIVDLPGAIRPEEIVVLSAHLDNFSANPQNPAPGADDNAAGIAALLEAARIFRQYRFARTIRLAFFTGEEAHEIGSRAYLAENPPKGVIANINLDMFSYDRDNDRCIELHASMLPASQPLAGCFQQSITSFGIDLKTEVVTGAASQESDQSSYWAYDIGALLVMENITRPGLGSVCPGTDGNPYYHSANDRIAHLNLETGFNATRAAIASIASLAQPLGLCRSEQCSEETRSGGDRFWQEITYRIR